MPKTNIEIDTEKEQVYQIDQVEALLKEVQDLRNKVSVQAQVIHERSVRERKIYQDTKKIMAIIPFEPNGEVNMMKLPRVITSITQNKDLIETFKGIADFVTEYEKTNLVIK